MKNITRRFSHKEVWDRWCPIPVRIKSGLVYSVITPMGVGIIQQDSETGEWVVKPGWHISRFLAKDEEKAIHMLVESYLQAEKKVLEAYIEGLKVNLGEVDKYGYVCNCVGGYTVRKGVERVDTPRGRESTEEALTREVYTLSYMGSVLEKNTDPHVWEDQITLVYQHELLEALNLR
nr:MAG TPA: Complement C5-like protein [Caudoviricetes sp.]